MVLVFSVVVSFVVAILLTPGSCTTTGSAGASSVAPALGSNETAIKAVSVDTCGVSVTGHDEGIRSAVSHIVILAVVTVPVLRRVAMPLSCCPISRVTGSPMPSGASRLPVLNHESSPSTCTA